MCSLCECLSSTSVQNKRKSYTFSFVAAEKSKDFELNANKHSQVLIVSLISS